jgi:hypothetical protein
MDDIRLPSDLEIRLMGIQLEHLNKEYDALIRLFRNHEIELAILWIAVLGLTGVLATQTYKEWKVCNER